MTWLLIPLAYLIGSISFAVVVSKCMRLPDPYSYGSGNPGATNVLRTGNKRAAVFTLLGDALKGWLAVVIARVVLGESGLAQGTSAWILCGVAIAVFLGIPTKGDRCLEIDYDEPKVYRLEISMIRDRGLDFF